MQKKSDEKKVLAGLVSAQNAIKNKFKRAYAERLSRNKKIKEIMSPVLSTYKDFERKNKVKKPNTFQNNSFTPKKTRRKTPKKSVSTSIENDSENSDENETGGISYDSGSDFEGHSSTPYPKLQDDNNSDMFTYKVTSDNDIMENYGSFPAKNVVIYGKKKNKLTGKTSLIKMFFKDLSPNRQKQWSSERKKIKDQLNCSAVKDGNRVLTYSSSDDDETLKYSKDDSEDDGSYFETESGSETTTVPKPKLLAEPIANRTGRRDCAPRREPTQKTFKKRQKKSESKAGKGFKKNFNRFDLNFIPYKANRNI